VDEGPPADTLCVLGTQGWVNYIAEPHFAPNPFMGDAKLPYTTFADADQPPNQCGNLSFDDRTRSITSYYATDTGFAGESPWKYWWRRSRRANNGVGELVEDTVVYREAPTFGQETVPVWLSQEYDAIGTILVLSDVAGLTIIHEIFIADTAHLNFAVQHWAYKPAPTNLTATRDGSNVTLTWTNEHAGRSLDSTNIYRDGTFRRTVAPADTSFVDSNLAPGTYRYSVKHLSLPSVRSSTIDTPWPNSASSNDAWVTIPTPDPLAMYVAGPDLITQAGTYSWSAVTSGGTPPYTAYRWDYRPFGTSTWTPVGTQSSYQRSVAMSDPWFWLRAAVWDDNPTDSVMNRRIAVEIWDQGGGAAPGADAVRVGVRLPDGTCSPRPPVGDPTRQAWLQMIMETVQRIAYCRVEKQTP